MKRDTGSEQRQQVALATSAEPPAAERRVLVTGRKRACPHDAPHEASLIMFLFLEQVARSNRRDISSNKHEQILFMCTLQRLKRGTT